MLKEREDRLEELGFEPLLSMKNVRDILGVSYGVIYALIREGKLPVLAARAQNNKLDRREER